MNKQFKYTLCILLACLGVGYYSCLDPVDLEVGDSLIDNLVIQGRLVKVDDVGFVEVSMNTAFTFSTPRSVEAQFIAIEDEEGDRLELERVATGRYQLTIDGDNPTIEIAEGKSYKIIIQTFDGASIESGFEAIPPPPPTDATLGFTQVERERINGQGELISAPAVQFSYEGRTTYEGTDEAVKLLFNASRHYKLQDYNGRLCYPINNIDVTSVNLFNGADFNSERAAVDVHDEFINSVFAYSYVFILVYESLSTSALEYFEQAQRLVQPSETIFREPSAKITGNFTNLTNPKEDIFGYFYTSQIGLSRLFVDSTDVGSPEILCLQPAPEYPPDICLDCPIFADTIMPFYFEN